MSFARILLLLGLGVGGALALRSAVGEGIYVASASMEPTLKVGASLWLDKLTFRLRDPHPGDIITFESPVPPVEDMIKRVIAVGGQTVELREKKVFVDGKELDEPYAKHSRAGERLAGDTMPQATVPAGSLFVLGDNRDESKDSAVWKDPGTGEPAPFLPMSKVRGLVRGFY